MSVPPYACNSSAPTVRFFMKFDSWGFLANFSTIFTFYETLSSIRGASHEDLWTYVIQGDRKVSVHTIFCIVIIRCTETFWSPCISWEMFQTKDIEKKTHVSCSVSFLPKCVPFMRHGTARQATDDSVIRRMRVACWITKATGTHSEYVIFFAFPLRQRLRERVLILRCTYIVFLVDNVTLGRDVYLIVLVAKSV